MTIVSDQDKISPSSSFSRRISRSPICCFLSQSSNDNPASSSPFNDSDSDSTTSDSSKSPSSSPSTSSSTEWLKFVGHVDLPKKCESFISRFGRRRRKRSANITAEFRYDPLSYALNFDDEAARFDDDLPVRNFSDRLPATPERFGGRVNGESISVVSREISAWS